MEVSSSTKNPLNLKYRMINCDLCQYKTINQNKLFSHKVKFHDYK